MVATSLALRSRMDVHSLMFGCLSVKSVHSVLDVWSTAALGDQVKVSAILSVTWISPSSEHGDSCLLGRITTEEDHLPSFHALKTCLPAIFLTCNRYKNYQRVRHSVAREHDRAIVRI